MILLFDYHHKQLKLPTRAIRSGTVMGYCGPFSISLPHHLFEPGVPAFVTFLCKYPQVFFALHGSTNFYLAVRANVRIRLRQDYFDATSRYRAD
jgi:hypothetical protein